eukprot:6174861-Pleurochrysis_carterae.AAC.1
MEYKTAQYDILLVGLQGGGTKYLEDEDKRDDAKIHSEAGVCFIWDPMQTKVDIGGVHEDDFVMMMDFIAEPYTSLGQR